MKKPKPLGTLKAKPLDPLEDGDLAAALKRETVTVELNAAQLMLLKRFSVRYRCTPAQLLLSLSLAWFAMQTGDPHAQQDENALDALLTYADGGETPNALSPTLPGQIDPEADLGFRAKCLRKAHLINASGLRLVAGEITSDEYWKLTDGK